MAFPSSPTNGQQTVQNGITYTYASATNSWTRSPATLPTLSVYIDSFTGDGVTTSFTLSVTPSSKDFVSINIDGVSQLKNAYSVLNNIITFTGVPDNGAIIEVKSWSSATVGVLTGLTYDSFTGDGTTTIFTLSTSPTNKNYTMVSIGGLTQNKNNYGVSGTTLTFTTAPPNTSPIEVVTFGPAINSAAAGGSNTQVQYNNNGTLSGSSYLTFNNSSNTLGTINLTASGNTTVTGNITVGNASLGNLATANFASISSNLTSGNANLGNLATANYFAGTLTTGAQPNITSLGTLTSISVSGLFSYATTNESVVPLTGATGNVTHNLSLGSTFYHTSPSANFIANFTNYDTTNNKVTVVGMAIVQGATPYLPTTVQINGITQTVKWLIGSSPIGSASKTDILSFSLFQVSGSLSVYGSYTYFG